jgi:hypothetical protein
MKKILCSLAVISAYLLPATSSAQTDTLHVLSYNVLYIGDTPPCQGPHSVYEGYLSQIISYTNADIVGLEKMAAIPTYSGDPAAIAPTGFADSLLQFAFDAAFPGRYAYCPFTNAAAANNICMLYYNQEKLGYAGELYSYSNITDFDTYKLYYKSADLATTHDTAFIYVTLNHTNSGTSSSDATTRNTQITGEMSQIESHFSVLPNMINMGDFNTHTSTEACYQTLVSPSNLSYRYYDPPFYPDATYSYPADWDDNPTTYAGGLTVSTRESSSSPNSCSGNTGGAKSWYDHIFLSAAIINNTDHISYRPNSFKVIGNDGNRIGKSANTTPNTSAPTAILNDIFQMSEHYPITLDLLVDAPPTTSLSTAEQPMSCQNAPNPFSSTTDIRYSLEEAGHVSLRVYNITGQLVATLVDGDMNAGSHAATFCAKDLPDGIYYAVLRTPSGTANMRMLLAR